MQNAIFNLVQNWYLTAGYAGIVLAMALESCCIPLPSEVVMPLAGYFALIHPGTFSLVGVGIAGAVGCLIGSAVAYGIGASGGRPLLLKYGKYVLISKADSDRADRWFARYGSPVAFFSRLLPVVRTYISLPAGIARMNFGKFLLFTLLGSLPWTFALAFIGYKFGDQVAGLGTAFRYLDILIVVLVVVGIVLYVRRHIKKERDAASKPESESLTSQSRW